MLIEIHIIQNHAPSNLNRDDSGSPKTAIFGGYRRARISSQCLKRCYRTSKTFRAEVDTLGMHTRSMPEEIKMRLLSHAATLTSADQQNLKAQFEEWADKSQSKLAAILGKGGNETIAGDDEAEEDAVDSAAVPSGDEIEPAEETAAKPTTRADKSKTAQSIFWREMELQALFEAYLTRINWNHDVSETMRKAFDDKGKVKVKDMLKAVEPELPNSLGSEIRSIKNDHREDSKKLDRQYPALASGTDAKKKEDREKKLKRAKAEIDEVAANAVAQLMVDRFDPKVVLRAHGLRPDGIPVDMALFGRMVASPLMHNVEGSSQFAHAISTHEFAREFDFWTRVDDRRDKRLDFYRNAFGADERLESGTDGMGDAEFTSACFYSYFNVDFCGLVDNLTGKSLKRDLDDSKDREAAKERACNAVVGLLKAAILERPTGKFNSMATPSLPTLVLVEVRHSHVPVSYADAFAKPVDPTNEETQSDTGQVRRVDLPKESAKRLLQEANRIAKAFRRTAKARLRFTGGADIGCELVGRDTRGNLKPTVEAQQITADQIPFTPVEDIDQLVEELRLALDCPEEKKDA